MPCSLDPNGKTLISPSRYFGQGGVTGHLEDADLGRGWADSRNGGGHVVGGWYTGGCGDNGCWHYRFQLSNRRALLASRGEWLHRCAQAAFHLSTLGGEVTNKSELLWRWCF